jgi:hypothetical protein
MFDWPLPSLDFLSPNYACNVPPAIFGLNLRTKRRHGNVSARIGETRLIIFAGHGTRTARATSSYRLYLDVMPVRSLTQMTRGSPISVLRLSLAIHRWVSRLPV